MSSKNHHYSPLMCHDCSELLSEPDIVERSCCRVRICRSCWQDYPECPDCASHANGATLNQIEVNLDQLNQEISRIQDIAEEQVEFYNQHGKVNGIWLPDIEAAFTADVKAITIHLELLHELAYRLALTCLDSLDLQSPTFNLKEASSSKTVLIPVGDFIRSKDVKFDQLVDSQAELRANDETKRQFFQDHHINHYWYGSIPPQSNFLTTLDLTYCKITEVAAISQFSHLKNLYLGHNSNIRNISALASCSSLQVLNLTDTRVDDLSALTNLPLDTLILIGTPVTDLEPLRGLKITQLDLSQTKVSDLSPLSGMPLNHLVLFKTRVCDISALKGCPLKILDLSQTFVWDISLLADMAIEDLRFDYTNVSDLSPLSGKPKDSLRKLSIWGSKVIDISSLQVCSALAHLSLAYTKVSDLSALKGLNLTYLNLYNSKVVNLWPLAGLPLNTLDISGCQISNISALKGLPLTLLRIIGTKIVDLSPVKDIVGLVIKS